MAVSRETLKTYFATCKKHTDASAPILQKRVLYTDRGVTASEHDGGWKSSGKCFHS